jgi:hypothetical protein
MAFYVRVQSDASLHHFKNNKISDFRNQLASTITLPPGQFQVALTECSYTYGAPFIKTGLKLASVQFELTGKALEKFGVKALGANVNARQDIFNFEQLAENIIAQLGDYSIVDITLSDDGYAKWFQDIDCIENGMCISEILFTTVVKNMLGFEDNFLKGTPEMVLHNMLSVDQNKPKNLKRILMQKNCKMYKATHKFSFEFGNTRMYIYTDIIKRQYVGDSMAPLLRMLPYQKDSAIIHKNFTNPMYMDLFADSFDQIHIYIRNEHGESIPFTLGPFTATLHFRRKRD